MTETNLGRVQGGGFFGSTSASETEIPTESVSAADIRPLVGDIIVNFNGALCRIDGITAAHYIVTKYGSVKGEKGDKGDRGEQGGGIDESGAYPNMTVGKATDADTLDGKHASEFATSSQGDKADNAVQITTQTLTNAQKTQARTNLGAQVSGNYALQNGNYPYMSVGQATADGNGKNIANTYLPLSGGTMSGGIGATSYAQSNSEKDWVDFVAGGAKFGIKGVQGHIYNLAELKASSANETLNYHVSANGDSSWNSATWQTGKTIDARKIVVGEIEIYSVEIAETSSGDHWIRIDVTNEPVEKPIYCVVATPLKGSTSGYPPGLIEWWSAGKVYIGLDENSWSGIDVMIVCKA